MTDTYKKQLKADVFETIGEKLRGYGFTLKASRDCFLQKEIESTNVFQLVCLDGKPGWRIQPNIGVRINRVEDIFHVTSGFSPEHQRFTVTIGGSIGALLYSDNQGYEFLLESSCEIDRISNELIQSFTNLALPYYLKYSTLSVIDAELNNQPDVPTPHRAAPWLRCSTGAIVAKLTNRHNYNYIVALYDEALTRVDKGFYLKRFRALIEYLQ